MEYPKRLEEIEREIDKVYECSPLTKLPFPQIAWSMLSLVEQLYYQNSVISPMSDEQLEVFGDSIINSLCYPLRVGYKNNLKNNFARVYDDNQVSQSITWLDKSANYKHFCYIFPLSRKGWLNLNVNEEQKILEHDGLEKESIEYEAYYRLTQKRDPKFESSLDSNNVAELLKKKSKLDKGVVKVDFDADLLFLLLKNYGPHFEKRHLLPSDWNFSAFSLLQFRKVFTLLQVMSFGWHIAIRHFNYDRSPQFVYLNSIWVAKKKPLIDQIAFNTKIGKGTVQRILDYITFGNQGINNPDIAIQPLVDTKQGTYLISPFLIMNVNAERNFCVLANQIQNEKNIYASLVNQKEENIRSYMISELNGMQFDFKHGKIDGTDVDLAIIDRNIKKCLIAEIKWFIEPAEIREIVDRTCELQKGVTQAQKIELQFNNKNKRLFDLLNIDDSYELMAIVCSENFTGHHELQRSNVPIIKVWHLLSEIRSKNGLLGIFEWLKEGAYLKTSTKYNVQHFDIQVGSWKSKWYGLKVQIES
ncbi:MULTISPECIES: hypothetical protein [Deefgea]|uniref:Restriction endonuclease n=1 Tax=Deefgea chitinilytica TaxID=570276 RepID=A0ABS2CBI8_9NEIS|nr:MULTISPECIES: hypothetical protein [Deefgea]MBM5570726.1 hypothetical protein [Deefgea chitinilytica]MBM9887955.1 hypothetical protein [Deefgea sp. CFH1-16]